MNEIPGVTTHIFDGMVLIQQLQTTTMSTFGDISDDLMKRIMKHPTVYFVTDRYQRGSIKSYERSCRAQTTGTLRIRIQRRDTPIPKQWSKYLKDGNNKTELVDFLLKDWADKTRFAESINGKTLFFNKDTSFFKLTSTQTEV